MLVESETFYSPCTPCKVCRGCFINGIFPVHTHASATAVRTALQFRSCKQDRAEHRPVVASFWTQTLTISCMAIYLMMRVRYMQRWACSLALRSPIPSSTRPLAYALRWDHRPAVFDALHSQIRSCDCEQVRSCRAGSSQLKAIYWKSPNRLRQSWLLRTSIGSHA